VAQETAVKALALMGKLPAGPVCPARHHTAQSPLHNANAMVHTTG
jgi:hypothetical protein